MTHSTYTADVVLCDRSLAAIDKISGYLREEGGRGSRSEVVRWALIRAARGLTE